jgi:hypothetical protein
VSGTDAADYLFGAVAGDLTVKQTGGGASANILADNFSTTGGVTINAVPCKWHTDTATTCDGSGINVTVQGTRRNSPTATYDITVTYL